MICRWGKALHTTLPKKNNVSYSPHTAAQQRSTFDTATSMSQHSIFTEEHQLHQTATIITKYMRPVTLARCAVHEPP